MTLPVRVLSNCTLQCLQEGSFGEDQGCSLLSSTAEVHSLLSCPQEMEQLLATLTKYLKGVTYLSAFSFLG